MLNALHMPLVHKYYNLFAFCLINSGKQVLVKLINKDLLKFREEYICTLDEPIECIRIEALFRESLWAH